jgi:acrylyl-CoA reductase (NADPH)
MKAFRIDKAEQQGSLVDLALDALDPGDVLVRTLYAGVNYKDALAGMAAAPIVRRYPCIGGIEAVGRVEESGDSRYRKGDLVIGHGRGLGVSHHGGFADYVRAPADWLVPLPDSLSAREAATLGVAGYSAALAVDRMEAMGVRPEAGPVAVTGATGGVGSLGIAMLARRGFSVTAVTSKWDQAEFLRRMGAVEIRQPPREESAKPIEAALWAGAIDAAGGYFLAWLLRTMKNDGVIASIGNAAGIKFETTVLPFILRGVSVTGINADSPMDLRRRIWGRLGDDLKPPQLAALAREIPLSALPETMNAMLAGTTTGRAIVAFQAE